MQSTRQPALCPSLLIAGLAIALSASACQDLRAAVTGEQFERAPENSPRVEVELVVEVEDGFYDDLEAVGELNEAITQRVQGFADLGMRLYPVLSSEYGEGDERPSYLMTVTVKTLEIEVENRLMEEEEREPWTESSVEALDCLASATVKRRRPTGPALGVGEGQGKGRVYVRGAVPDEEQVATWPVAQKSADQQALRVAESDLLGAVDAAVIRALRNLIKSVDRDLALGAPSEPAKP